MSSESGDSSSDDDSAVVLHRPVFLKKPVLSNKDRARVSAKSANTDETQELHDKIQTINQRLDVLEYHGVDSFAADNSSTKQYIFKLLKLKDTDGEDKESKNKEALERERNEWIERKNARVAQLREYYIAKQLEVEKKEQMRLQNGHVMENAADAADDGFPDDVPTSKQARVRVKRKTVEKSAN